ncbi:hypothetical protein FD754_003482 [Muntiacus muntjak]|uniref:C2H2-type domain-containing protein n=1 Tax=Muntiacus muntjak TaxID=9888 RepID=A0A5N3WGD6_MUNMU|nr:hypothetical protein FD754_003482 [Muntiacus muntjak]
MNEYPKKKKRKTLHPSRYSDSSGINLKYFDNKIFDSDTETANELPKFTDYDSPESGHQQTQEESPVKVHAAEDVPIAREVHAISEDWDIETGNHSSESLQVHQLVADEEPLAELCRIVDKSQALNVTAQQKWPLLRASNSGLYKCELCECMILKHRYTGSNVCRVCKERSYIYKYCDDKTAIFENFSQRIADTHFSGHLYWCEQYDIHNCGEQYLCQFCEREMNDPEDLHSHVGNQHACKLIVNRLHTNVNRHVATEYSKNFPHVCDDCGKDFSSMLEYCKHLNSHLSEGIYLCQYCEYSTGQIEDLKIHLDFKFGNERELISHLPVHETT